MAKGTSADDSLGTKSHFAHINDLPIEVLINIFGNLEMTQLGSVRMVCKNWNQAVSAKETWVKSFSLKFGAHLKFPSVTNLSLWMQEYFTRLKIYKKWNKARGKHQSYQLINNEYRNIDFALVDFDRNQNLGKLLTFSKRFGIVTTCNAVDGKSQTFVPSLFYSQISAYSMNWNYLLMGLRDGTLILRNLTTSGTNSSSLTKYDSIPGDEGDDLSDDLITATAMNSYSNMDKFKLRADTISGSSQGKLRFWNTSGKLLHQLNFDKAILNIKSDFNKFVIMNTATSIFIIDFQDYQILCEIDLEDEILVSGSHENIYNYYGTRSEEEVNDLDIDFGDYNIILCYRNAINVYNFRNIENILHRQLILDDGITIVKSQLQTTAFRKVSIVGTRDLTVAGKDGLFYGNVLSDTSVIIWNIRQNGPIILQCQIWPSFSKHHPTIPPDIPHVGYITSFALNSSVVAVGGYNGFTNVYNIFTGEFIKEVSMKFPRKFDHMYTRLVPINAIKLNEDQLQANGVIICGDTIQYFQFGDKDKLFDNEILTKAKKRANKINLKYSIMDELNDYDEDQYNKKQMELLYDKYNGNEWEDEQEQLSTAIALSQSSANDLEADLQLALELSKAAENTVEAVEEYEEDEELKRILELSLIDN